MECQVIAILHLFGICERSIKLTGLLTWADDTHCTERHSQAQTSYCLDTNFYQPCWTPAGSHIPVSPITNTRHNVNLPTMDRPNRQFEKYGQLRDALHTYYIDLGGTNGTL